MMIITLKQYIYIYYARSKQVMSYFDDDNNKQILLGGIKL